MIHRESNDDAFQHWAWLPLAVKVIARRAEERGQILTLLLLQTPALKTTVYCKIDGRTRDLKKPGKNKAGCRRATLKPGRQILRRAANPAPRPLDASESRDRGRKGKKVHENNVVWKRKPQELDES